jgi:ribosome-binding factor A
MSRRLEQVNELLRAELAQLLARIQPLEKGLVTITYVKCSADLRQAKIGISVLPESLAGTTLKNLRHHNPEFVKILKKKLKFKFIPKFIWQIDSSERYTAEINKIFKDLRETPPC